MGDDRRFGITSQPLADKDVVVDQGRAVVHLQEDGLRLRVIDDVARDSRSLVGVVHPDAIGGLLLVKDAADQVAADDGIDAVVKLNPGRLPAAEFPAVVRIFDEITLDDGSRRALLAGDARLAAATNDVITDDVVSEGVDVTIVHARRMSQDNTDAASIDEGAILDNPVLSHARADGARLKLQHRGRPVRRRVHEMKAVDGDIFQTGDLRHEKTLANVDFSEFRVGISWAEIRTDNRLPVNNLAMPALLRFIDLFGGLLFIERLAVQINVAAMVPLAVIQPAAGDLQGVGIVIAEEGVGQLDRPDAASPAFPGGHALGAFDDDLLTRCGPVDNTFVLAGSAPGRLDPLAIRPGVDRHGIPRLRDGRRLADGQVGIPPAAGGGIASRFRHVNLARRDV